MTLFLAACLQAALVMNGRIERGREAPFLSALATAALLTRMDAVILFAGPVRRCSSAAGSRGIIPTTAIFSARVLPEGGQRLIDEQGLRYFYIHHVVQPRAVPLFCIFFFGAIFRRKTESSLCSATALFWCAYVLKLGILWNSPDHAADPGDDDPPDMALFGCTPKRWLRAAGILLILGGSIHHAETFTYDRETGVEPVGMLSGHLFAPEENWVGIGRALSGAFGPSDDVVIATTAAGAIPFYAGLRAVDMLGLNEPADTGSSGGTGLPAEGAAPPDEGLLSGVFVSSIPGHQRVLPYEYLNRRKVNLVISHPIVTRVGEEPGVLPLLSVSGPPHLSGMVISMPIGGGYQVEMLYIRPNPAVDSALARFAGKAGGVLVAVLHPDRHPVIRPRSPIIRWPRQPDVLLSPDAIRADSPRHTACPFH